MVRVTVSLFLLQCKLLELQHLVQPLPLVVGTKNLKNDRMGLNKGLGGFSPTFCLPLSSVALELSPSACRLSGQSRLRRCRLSEQYARTLSTLYFAACLSWVALAPQLLELLCRTFTADSLKCDEDRHQPLTLPHSRQSHSPLLLLHNVVSAATSFVPSAVTYVDFPPLIILRMHSSVH